MLLELAKKLELHELELDRVDCTLISTERHKIELGGPEMLRHIPTLHTRFRA